MNIQKLDEFSVLKVIAGEPTEVNSYLIRLRLLDKGMELSVGGVNSIVDRLFKNGLIDLVEFEAIVGYTGILVTCKGRYVVDAGLQRYL